MDSNARAIKLVIIDDNLGNLELLTAALQRAAGPAGGPPDNAAVVIVSADALTPHQSVISVMDAARRAGLTRLTFAAQLPASSGNR